MRKTLWGAAPALCAVAITSLCSTPAGAQATEVKEKPPMYSYVSNWAIPRARWADFEKQDATDAKVFDRSLTSGTLVGYGTDADLIHQADGYTHDTFWSAMSLGAVLNVLDDLQKSGSSAAPVLVSATKHSDQLFVSRFYNWKPGSYKNVYTHGASYKLKPDAPEDAVETISKSFVVPFYEKLLADGTVQEYEVDTEAIHTESPGTFWIFYITQTPDGLDKVNAALDAALKANTLAAPAFGSMVDFSAHRDYLAHTNATYK